MKWPWEGAGLLWGTWSRDVIKEEVSDIDWGGAGVHVQCVTGTPDASSEVAGVWHCRGWIDMEIVMATITIVTKVIIKIMEL